MLLPTRSKFGRSRDSCVPTCRLRPPPRREESQTLKRECGVAVIAPLPPLTASRLPSASRLRTCLLRTALLLNSPPRLYFTLSSNCALVHVLERARKGSSAFCRRAVSTRPLQMSNRPGRHPPSAQPTHNSSQSDETWLDYLRSAGDTAPADRSTPTERKRRHTGSSPEERRGYRHPVYNPAMTSRGTSGPRGTVSEGSRMENVAGRTTISRPQRCDESRSGFPVLGNTVTSEPERRSSDFLMPRWQPDGEVNTCFVCGTEFSFWYRKHHCRKCGKVVCAACSQHRITIPKEYIVLPPTVLDIDRSPPPPTSSLFPRNPALDGREVVRVCNPCVPDPWTPDAAQGTATRAFPEDPRRRDIAGGRQISGFTQQAEGMFPGARASAPSDQRFTNFHRNLTHAQSPPRASLSGSRPTLLYEPPPPWGPILPNTQSTQTLGRTPPHANPSPPPRRASLRAHAPPTPPMSAPANRPSQSASLNPPPAQRRREIREEDECPVCGEELQPDEASRQAHIQECIAARFATPPAVPPVDFSTGATSLPTYVPGSATNPTLASTSTPPSGTPAEGSRPRTTSYRSRGMVVYRATEKDCATEDGEPQECIICFEEFQPGDEMGRMECLCKFHRLCIRTWWDSKKEGSCPTHQLHG